MARSLLEENVVQRELVAQRPHHGELVEQPILRGELSPFPERPGELDLRAEKRSSAAEAACILAHLAEAGLFPSSLVAYAKRWSRDSGRSSLRERVLGRDRLASRAVVFMDLSTSTHACARRTHEYEYSTAVVLMS